MKKIFLFLKCMLLLGLCFLLTDCKANEPTIPDPEGTVQVNMLNCHYDCTSISPDGCKGSFLIDYDNNLFGMGSDEGFIQFLSLGATKGIGEIDQIPDKPASYWGWKSEVNKGYGYIGADCDNSRSEMQVGVRFFQLFVVDYIKDTSGEVIGAIVKHHSPFEMKPNASEITVSETEINFPLSTDINLTHKTITVSPLNNWTATSSEPWLSVYINGINTFTLGLAINSIEEIEFFKGKTVTVTIKMQGLPDKIITVNIGTVLS